MPDFLTTTLFADHPDVLWLAVIGALCIGMAKAGLAGTGLVSVLLFAQAFGAKASTGVVLPMLIAADLMGYYLLRGSGRWRQIVPLVPPAILGVVAGWWLLDQLDNAAARVAIGWLILGLLGLKLLLDWRREQLAALHKHISFTWALGIAAGIATMLANAAGPVMTVYLLARRFEKNEYLGIFSRFFLFINLVKVPFSVQIGLINGPTLMTNLVLLPVVLLGAIMGWQVVKVLPQKTFEWVMFAFALVAAIRLVF